MGRWSQADKRTVSVTGFLPFQLARLVSSRDKHDSFQHQIFYYVRNLHQRVLLGPPLKYILILSSCLMSPLTPCSKSPSSLVSCLFSLAPQLIFCIQRGLGNISRCACRGARVQQDILEENVPVIEHRQNVFWTMLIPDCPWRVWFL